MADALLFFRTNATRQALVPDPQNLPVGQRLNFSFPDNVLEGIERVYKNNLSKTPGLSNSGVRKITLDDTGVKTNPTYRVHGNFENPEVLDSVTKLFFFESILQIEQAFHVEGIFGLLLPGATPFDTDPDSTKGLGIEGTMLKHKGPSNTIFDFAVDLTLGGTYAPPAP